MKKKGTLFATLLSLMVLASLILTPLVHAQTVLFSDNFSSGFGNWDSSSDWQISSGAARARQQTNGDALQKNNISTICYQDINLDFDYSQSRVDSGEGVVVSWRVGGGSWNSLGLFRGSSSWQHYNTTLSGAENNTNLQIRFVPTGLDSYEYWYLDNVVVEGHALENNSIGDFVYDTDTGNPLSGVTVELWNDNNGNSVIDGGDDIEATTTTDGTSGANYDFTSLPADDYVVRAFASSGYYPPSQDHAVSISGCGQDYNDADLGFDPTATINGRVWYDDDRDGSQSGDAGIDGVTVDLSGPVNLSVDTSGGGYYEFSAPAGTYTVQVDEGTLPTGRTDLAAGINPTAPFSVSAGGTETNNFGYDDSATIGGRIWDDQDGDGGFDAGEPGLDWQVTLEDSLSVETHLTPNPDGTYSFIGLPADTYIVSVDVLPGWAQTNFQEHPLVVNLAASDDYNDADFGFSDDHANVSGYVWYDQDRSGTRDPGETTGINGINVVLNYGLSYIDDVDTNVNGFYFFGGLDVAGEYQVDVNQNDPDLDPVLPVRVITTDDPQDVPDVDPGEEHSGYDFGFAEPPLAVKPLYLSGDSDLTRTRPTGATPRTQPINSGATYSWQQTPELAEPLILVDDEDVIALLRIESFRSTGVICEGEYPDVEATLRIVGGPTLATDTILDMPIGLNTRQFNFDIAPGTTIPEGARLELVLSVSDAGCVIGDGGYIIVYYDSASELSRLEIPTYSYVHLEEATTYSGPYSGGAPLDVFLSGDTVYFRATAADPFGYDDITGATLTVPGVLDNVPMSRQATPDAAIAICEYAHTGFGLGEHTYTITATEGSEGEIVAVGTGTFRMIISDLTESYKEVDQDTAEPGDTLQYTVHVVNTGGASATNVTVIDPIPAHTTWNGVVSGASYDSGLNAIMWQGTVPALTEYSFSFQVELDPVLDNGLEIENTAWIDDGINPEPFPRSIQTTIVSAPDLDHTSTTKEVWNYTQAASGDTADPGDELEYTLTLVNDGNMNSSASLDDVLPDHTTLVEGTLSASSGNASYDAGSRTIQWNGTVPGGGGSVVVTFRVLIEFPLDNGTLITNTVSIDDGFEPNGTDPFEREVVTTIVSEPLIEANSSKLVDEITAEPGDTLHYTIYLVNGGKMNAPTVSLVDPLPPNTSYAGGLWANIGTANWDGFQVTWDGPVNPDAPVEIRFRVTADTVLDNGLVIANTATVDDGYPEHDPFDLEAETTIVSAPDLEDSYKTVSASIAVPGQTLDYEIHVVNTGDMIAHIQITDTLSSDLVNVSVTSPPEASYDAGLHAILWEGDVTPGPEVVIEFGADVRSPLDSPQTIIYNTATVDDGVHAPFDIFPPVQTTVNASPNLQTSTKAVNTDTASPGDVLTYTITLINTGNMNAWVYVQDIMPAHTTYVAGSLDYDTGTGDYDTFNNWIWWEGMVAPGQPQVIVYEVQIDAVMDEAETTIYNDARIDDGENTPFNTAGVTTIVYTQPDLSTSTKVVDLDETEPGQQLWYRIRVANTGNMVAHSASVSDTLPSEVTYLSGQFPTGGGYNAVDRYVYWSGDVVPGQDVIIDYYVTINDPLDDGTIIENTAEINDGYVGHPVVVTDPPAQTLIHSAPNLGTSTKVVDKGTAAPGEELEYTITLINTGDMNAYGVSITDTIPADTSYVAGSVTGGATYDAGNDRILWNGDVLKGVPVVITFRVLTDSPLDNGTQIDNEAEIYDGFAETLIRSANTEIGSAPNLLASTKTVDRPTAAPGDVLEYTITLRNTGNQNATNVDLTDVLPDNVAWAGWVTQNGATYSAGTETITWSGTVNADDEITFVYQVTVALPLDNNTLIENTATVDDGVHDAFETSPAAQTLIQSTPDLLTSDKAVENVTTGGSGDTAAPGDELEYTITLRNTGRMTAHSATMYDYLPDDVEIVDLSWTATSGSVSYTEHNRRIFWNGSVSPLVPVVVTYKVTIDEPLDDLTQIINDATIGDGIHSPFDTDPVVTVVHSAPDLTASTKEVDRGTASPGDQLRYTITLINEGNMVAQASVVDELPDHVTHFSGPTASSGSASWDGFNNRVLWSGQVHPGTPVVIQYYVTVNNPTDDGTEINNTCEIDDGYPGHELYSPPETSTFVTSAPNLGTSTKEVDLEDAEPGDVLEYTITLNNTGTQVAHDAWVTDPLPTDTSWAGGLTWSGGTATWDGSQVRWDGDVYPGSPVVIRFRVQVNAPLDDDTDIVNTATINDGFTGHADIQRQATTTVHSAPDLSTSTKAVDRSTAHPGEELEYTITLINTGDQVAHDAWMSDQLPPNTAWADGPTWSGGGTATWDGSQVRWDGDVHPDTPVVIQYRVTIASVLDNGTVIENRASINDGFPGHGTFQTPPAQTTIESSPNLQEFSVKEVSTDTASPGEVIIYTITLVNSGDMNASAYVIDSIPSHTTYVPGSADASSGFVFYDLFQDRIEWDGTVEVGTPVIITYAVQTDTPLNTGTLIWNTATIGDGVHGPFNTDAANTLITSAPNLQPNSSKTVNLGDADPGDLIRYTIELVNDGDMTAGNTQVEDPLPPEVTFANGPFASSGSAAWDSFNNRVLWSGAVAPGAPVIIQYDVTINDPLDDLTVIANYATVDDNFIGHTGFDVGPAQTTVHSAPDLSTSTKEVDLGSAQPSDFLEYTITLVNSGDMNAGSVSLTDELPALTTFDQILAGGATYDGGSNSIEWAGAINTGAPVIIRYRVQLDPVIEDGTLITNTAAIEDGFPGHDPVETVEAVTVIGSAPNLSTSTKEVDQGTAAPNSYLLYTITLRNSGNAVATGATLTDVLPDHVEWDGWVAQNGAGYDGGSRTVTWTGDVDPGVDVVIVYRVQVESPLDDNTVIENTATVNDGVHGDEEIGPAQTSIDSAPDLETSSIKEVNTTMAAPGEVLTYTVTLVNDGDMVAHEAEVDDYIPNHSSYVAGSLSSTDGTAEYQPLYDLIHWTGEVEPGTPVVIEFAVELDFPLDNGTQIINWATIDDNYHDSFDTNQVVTVIGAAPDMSGSSKAVDLAIASPDDELHYTITLVNDGSQTANAHMEDVLPAEVTFASGPVVTGGGIGGWDAGGRRIYWDGQVAPGQTVTIEYYVTVNNPLDDGTIIANTAQIDDGVQASFDTNEVETVVDSAPDLSASVKEVDQGTASPGDRLEYVITLDNVGDMNATNVTVVDTLPPAYVTLVAVPSGATYDAGTGTLTWTGLTVNTEAPVVLTFQVDLDDVVPDGTFIVNHAAIDDGFNPGLVEREATTIIGSAPNLTTSTKEVNQADAAPGEYLEYTITLRNTGNAVATGASLTDVLPANVAWDGWVTQNGAAYDAGSNTVTWTGDVAPDADVVIVYRVQVEFPLDDDTLIENWALVDDNFFGPFDIGPAQTTIHSTPGLTTSFKEVDATSAAPGQELEYTLTIINTGNMVAHGAELLDNIPNHSTYVPTSLTFTSGFAEYQALYDRIRWTGEVEPGTDVVITFRVELDFPLADGTEVVNWASVDDNFHAEPFDTNTTVTTIGAAPDMSGSSKAVDLAIASPDDELRYTITLVNDGSMTADAHVDDVLPAEVAFVSGPVVTGGGSGGYDAGGRRIYWDGQVAPDHTVTILYYVRVNNPLDDGTIIANTAQIDDGVQASFDTNEVETVVDSAPDLSASVKEVDQGTASPGDRLEYVITLDNVGDMNATNVTVVDTLPPAYVTLVAVPSGATYDAGTGTLTWTGLTVNTEAPVVLTFQVDLDDVVPDGTFIVNHAAIDDGFNPGLVEREATTIIGSAPNLTTSTKEVNQADAAPGEYLEYTITLRNTGNATAVSATVSDMLPTNVTWDGWVTQNGAVWDGVDTVSWTGDVAPGMDEVIAYRVQVEFPLDDGTVIRNWALVDDNFTGHAPFDIGPAQTTIHSAPNLETSTKAVDLTDAGPGDELEYTVTLVNTGDMTAHNAVVLDEIPADTTYVNLSASATSGSAQYQPAYNRIRWTGEVEPGTDVVITYRVEVAFPLNDGTEIHNFATVDDGIHSPTDTGTVVTTIHSEPNLATSSKTVDLTDAVPGQVLHYVITLVNTGDMSAFTTATDELPSEVSHAGGPTVHNGPPASWDPITRRIYWSGGVVPGTDVVIEYYVTVNSPLDDGTVIENYATVDDSFAGHDPFDIGPAQTTVHSAPNLATSTKEVDRDMAPPGALIEYAITLQNDGNMNASTVTMTDTLPVEVSFVSGPIVTGGTASYDSVERQVIWNGVVNVGQPVTIRYTVRLNSDLTEGTLVENTATVDDGRGTVFEIGPTTTYIGREVGLNLTDDRETVQPGEPITYTIAFSGTEPLGVAIVEIDIPENTSFVDASSGYEDTGAGSIRWMFIQTQPDFRDERYLVIELDPVLDNGTVISTVAEVAGSNGQSNQATESATVVSSPDLASSFKEVSNPEARAGESVTYRIVLTNTGNMHAYNVTITDTIPTEMIYEDNLIASSGTPTYTNGDVRWSDEVRVGTPVEITFDARVGDTVLEGTVIENVIHINDGVNDEVLERSADIAVASPGPRMGNVYLPLIYSGYGGVLGPDIELTIRNCGDSDATGAFWVDLYINPDESSPFWPISHGEGYDWFGQGAGFVVSTLGAGQSLTLYLDDAIVSDIPDSLSESLRLYAQVDWVDSSTPDIGVIYEGAGGEGNNVFPSSNDDCNATPGLPDLIVQSIRVVGVSGERAIQQVPVTPLEGGALAPPRPQPPQP